MLIGAWTFVSGLVRIFIGIAVRPMPHWRVMLIAGVLGVVIGLYIITQPVVGTVVLVWALGIYAIVYGAGRIVQRLSSGPAGGQATL